MKYPFSFKRTDDEKLLNEGVRVKIGGRMTPESRKVIYVREPSMRQTGNLILSAIETWEELREKEKKWAENAAKNIRTITLADIVRFKPIVEFFENEIADIVEEDVDYVNDEMTPSQVMEVITAWVKVVGMERIRDLFFQMRAEFRKFVPEADKNGESPVEVDEKLSAKS